MSNKNNNNNYNEDDEDDELNYSNSIMTSSMLTTDTFKDKINPNSSLYKSLSTSYLNNSISFNNETPNGILCDNRELITLQRDIEDYLNSVDNEDINEKQEHLQQNNDISLTFLTDANEAIKKQQDYIKVLEKQLKQDRDINNNLKSQSTELTNTNKELLELKSKYNELERSNKLLITKIAESKLSLENSEKASQAKIANKNLEIDELSKKVKFLSNCEQELTKKLTESEKKFEDLQRNTKLKIDAIEKEKLQCRTDVVELKRKNSSQSDLSSLQKSQDSEIQHLKSQTKKYEEQINSQKQILDSTLKLLSEKEKQLANSHTTSTSPSSSSSDSQMLIQSLRSEISYYKEINKEQKQEIERLKNIFENVGNLEMLKQGNNNMKEKIKRLEPIIEKYNNLQVEYNQLLNYKNQMESTYGTIEKQQNLKELQQKITQLENENQTLIGKVGEITSNWKLMESRNQDHQLLITQQKELLAEKDLKINEFTEKIKRIEKLNYLLNRERDNIKNILDTYDDDNNGNTEQSSNDKLRIDRINELERALKEKNLLIQDYEYKLDVCSSNGSGGGDFSGIDYREECKKLNKDIEKLLQENALLEARLGKGEYDPTTTKVLHFTNNPTSLILNDNNINNNNNSSSTSTVVDKEQADKKLIDENHRLYIQINDSEKKMDRLKQIFKQKINEFREAVYALLGFKIDVDTNNRYKLQSMYAERETDFLMFQQSGSNSKNGKLAMELLETDFTRSLDKEIKAYLFTCKSIPSFLSQVTIELFSRQTFHP